MAKMTKREVAYYQQRQRERNEWRALKEAAQARCAAIVDLDELAEAARDYLIASADLYRFEHGKREPETLARMLRRANSPDYCRVWAIHQLAGRLKKMADESHDMTADERATYDARQKAEAAALGAAIRGLISGRSRA